MTKIIKIEDCRNCGHCHEIFQIGEYKAFEEIKRKFQCVFEYGYFSNRDMEVSVKELDIEKGIPNWCELENYDKDIISGEDAKVFWERQKTPMTKNIKRIIEKAKEDYKRNPF